MNREINGIAAIFHAGGFFGIILSAYASDAWGRKASFAVNTVLVPLFALSQITVQLAHSTG